MGTIRELSRNSKFQKFQNHLEIHFEIIPKNKSVLKVLIKVGPIGLEFFV
jgi:hypothetical protein